jgi:hypothetical protein
MLKQCYHAKTIHANTIVVIKIINNANTIVLIVKTITIHAKTMSNKTIQIKQLC